MLPTISLILDTRRMKKTKKYPVKLRVTFKRVTEYYQTVFDLLEEEWKKLQASRISNELQSIRDKLKDLERNAEAVINEIEPFSFCEFEKNYIQSHPHFRQKKLRNEVAASTEDNFDYNPFHKKFPLLLEPPSKPGIISYSYIFLIKRLIREGRISTAMNYHGSYISLKKFKGDVAFTAITASYLSEYERWLLSQELSKSTIGIYLRPLRVVFNEAIEDGIIKREKCYPFGKRKYRIPSSKNVKKALELSDIQRIYYYKCNSKFPGEQAARDYWLFSYFGNGMNPKDIANLKYKNIEGDYLTFERSKTERSLRSDPKLITVFLNDDMKAIIERFGNKNKNFNNYIFPILEHNQSPLRQYELVQNFVGFINDWMKRIFKNLGINKKATTYVARHTFSTVLKRSGVSTEFIQEALGHTDLKTTENYLDSFSKEVKKELAAKLTSFKMIEMNEMEFTN
jgi:integrase/recombinase XerD